jgi:2-polyprenyl-6-methoxyphenol hydroxylase-like FAD-dependent oxidoreductase
MPQIEVLIVGAGLGGLCLAQSLRKANIQLEIFERDSSPWKRPQVYRLHLEADALNALREVLPLELHRLFKATAMRTEPFTNQERPIDDWLRPHWERRTSGSHDHPGTGVRPPSR